MLGGGANIAAISFGHWPQRRHDALMADIAAQSLGVISPAPRRLMWNICMVTTGRQSPGFRLCLSARATRGCRSWTTSPIGLTPRELAPRRLDFIRRGNSDAGKAGFAGSTICSVFRHSRLRPTRPPCGVVRGVAVGGFTPADRRELFQDRGCRLAPAIGQAPELRRRLSAFETGSYAPAACRHGVVQRQKDPAIHLHAQALQGLCFRQVHQ